MKTLRLIHFFPVLVGTTLFTIASLAFAQDAVDEKPVHCLSTNRIKQSEVISNTHIVFRMRDNSAYVNVLSHACPGLRRNTPVLYRSSIGKICDLDVVTVLDHVGFGLMPGASCGLGDFKPVDEQGIADLKEALKSGHR